MSGGIALAIMSLQMIGVATSQNHRPDAYQGRQDPTTPSAQTSAPSAAGVLPSRRLATRRCGGAHPATNFRDDDLLPASELLGIARSMQAKGAE